MNEYYAVQRSAEHLAHYGVKGMRWGVRKAIAQGNRVKLERQYQKASKKLKKLNERTNIEKQKELAKKHARRAALAAGISGVAMGINYKQNADYRKEVAELLAQHQNDAVDAVKTTARRKKIVGEGKGIYKWGNNLIAEYLGADHVDAPSAYMNHPAFNSNQTPTKSTTIGNSNGGKRKLSVLGAIGLAGLGTAAYQTGKAISAKRATTKKGHAKAVAKRNEWNNEMRKAFAGTPYAIKTNKRRKSK